MKKNLEIASHFATAGSIAGIRSFGNGHINTSFRIDNQDAKQPDYLLQRINHHVFPDVAGLMRNISLVTAHIRQSDSDARTLRVIPTVDGQLFYMDVAGNCWRMYELITDLASQDVPRSEDDIYRGARAFGQFLYLLNDFPVDQLSVTIADFHNVLKRLEQFSAAVQSDAVGRLPQVREDVRYAFDIADEMSCIELAGRKGRFPQRVTHNDTKFNNVLLDQSGERCCVVDLDTVMPGYVHYDFGDGIRTTVTTAAEDEADLSKIQVDLLRFEAFTAGYLEAAHAILAEDELAYLALSGALLSYLMGIRFLTDYLSGDTYYKTDFPGQNLQRARAQLALTRELLTRQSDLEAIIRKYA